MGEPFFFSWSLVLPSSVALKQMNKRTVTFLAPPMCKSSPTPISLIAYVFAARKSNATTQELRLPPIKLAKSLASDLFFHFAQDG